MLPRCLAAGLLGVVFLVSSLRADEMKKDRARAPLDIVPSEADFYVSIRHPREVAETILNLEVLGELQKFPAFKEQLESTNVRRFLQLLAYFEKTLGGKWPALLDRLAGNGVVLAGKLGTNEPALLVVQGKDEKTTEKFVPLLIEVIDGELARQENKNRVVKETLRDVEIVRVGEEFFLARVGPSILIANRKVALRRGLDLAAGRDTKSLASLPIVADAQKLLPEKAFATFWLNMAPIQASPQGKELYKTPRDNGGLTVLFGNFLDVLGRAPFVTGGVFPEKDGFSLSVRLPVGRSGAGAELALTVPPSGKVSMLPLLEPRNVLYSDSFYFDVSRIWTDREKLLVEKQLKQFEEFDKTSPRFLAGSKMSDLLTTAGSRHRTVVVHQGKVGYKKEPKQKIPAFAFIAEMGNPEKFGPAMATVLRAAALLASTQFGLKMEEEERKDAKIVAYRFDEKKELKQDVNDIRFNFSPCFARVGDQFIFCSTVELCRELVDLLQSAPKRPPEPTAEHYRARLLSSGVAALLKDGQDQFITQAILDQAVPASEAREQVKAFIDLVHGLGSLGLSYRTQDQQTRYEVRVRTR
jgi:hypothetical protein